MNVIRFVLAATLVASAAAHAATRQDVKADYVRAQRNGDLVIGGEVGQTLRERFPERYPASSVPSLTRAQVVAQYEDARRTGDLIAAGDSGRKLNEIHPVAYSELPHAAALTRADVIAELREAVRTGDVPAGDTGVLLREIDPNRYPLAPRIKAPAGAAVEVAQR